MGFSMIITLFLLLLFRALDLLGDCVVLSQSTATIVCAIGNVKCWEVSRSSSSQLRTTDIKQYSKKAVSQLSALDPYFGESRNQRRKQSESGTLLFLIH